ncbi:MAG TPA: EAL domain-containing protein [Caulobacterales bacterium]|nr:EAL domain-containing protein [Caulobacterales bacterium]
MNSAQNSERYSDDLRRLMLWVGAGIAGFGLLLLAIIAYAGWSANASAVEREHQLVANALNRAITRSLDDLKSVAWWDDSVINITDRRINTAFVDANMGQFLTDTYDHDEVYVLNAAGRAVYAYFNNERQAPAAYAVRAADIAPVLSEMRGEPSRLQRRPGVFAQGDYRYLAGGGGDARWAGHIVSVGGRPAIVAAMSIVPNVDMSLAPAHPHVLLAITFIDQDFLSALGQQLLLPDLTRQPRRARGDGRVSQPFVSDDGVSLGDLTWTARRPGQVLLFVILPLAALGVVCAGLFSAAMLRRLKRASADLARREAQTRHEAQHDSLSGLPNRSYFLDELDRALASRGTRRFAIAYVDIDRFKDVNDTLGHDAGDRLVKAVAMRLRRHLRSEDFLARFGGDEFAVLSLDASQADAVALGRSIKSALVEPFSEHGGSIRVTASVGLALAPEHGETSDALLRSADIALYEAKAHGRDCAAMFSEEMAEAVEMRRQIEVDLRAAVADDTLEIAYQPLIAAHSGAVVAVEALLRWRHPTRGDIEPDAFVPIAEDLGLMPEIGAQVLRRALADAARWPDVEIAVNFSRTQFRDAELSRLLDDIAAREGVAAERITLEVTEGVLLDPGSQTQDRLDGWRRKGYKIALDDFGAGYSSLAHLCNFKLDKIKIDGAFVCGAAKRDNARAIVQAVVTLGRGLGMEIVAEGVETEGDAAAMRQLGVNTLQGFVLARPGPAREIDALLAARAPSPLRAAAGE